MSNSALVFGGLFSTAKGFSYAVLPASSASGTVFFFGHNGMVLRYALNQSISGPQSNINLYDAPSINAYNNSTSSYNLITRIGLGTGASSNGISLLSLTLQYGCVVVVTGAGSIESDGGILFAFDGYNYP